MIEESEARLDTLHDTDEDVFIAKPLVSSAFLHEINSGLKGDKGEEDYLKELKQKIQS